MTTWQESYMRRFYRADADWRDGTTEFHELCRRVVPHGGRILEIGAGPTNKTSAFLGTLGVLHGVDIDPDAMSNEALVERHVVTDDRYPVEDGAFDVCVSNYVAEHVEHPLRHLREVARVLKPGGAYIIRTPNATHYVSVISKLTPFWFHRLVANRLRNLGRESHDPYPTFYAMNSRARLTSLAQEAGMVVDELRLVEKEPSYGMSSRVLFLAFVGYERIANSSEAASFLRANMFAVLRKPGPAK